LKSVIVILLIFNWWRTKTKSIHFDIRNHIGFIFNF